MLQVENEYTGKDTAYIEWAVQMARNATTLVPWNLCHDHALCAKVNAAAPAEARAICTINGFWMDTFPPASNPSQPSPRWVLDQRANNANEPVAWTEDQGWYDQLGLGHRVRRTSDQLYGIARFLAYGGSYHNFYMLTCVGFLQSTVSD